MTEKRFSRSMSIFNLPNELAKASALVSVGSTGVNDPNSSAFLVVTVTVEDLGPSPMIFLALT